jgi:hypothetical protein
MTSGQLERTYSISGLDRILYRAPPAWARASFVQSDPERGILTLWSADVSHQDLLPKEIAKLDEIALSFTLALARRFGRQVRHRLVGVKVPAFTTGQGGDLLTSTAFASDEVVDSISPGNVPSSIEQYSTSAERHVRTLSSISEVSQFQDACVKLAYLVIEELQSRHQNLLSVDDKDFLRKCKLVRNFVSHPICDDRKLVAFILSELPSARSNLNPSAVQFDRTNIEHMNFIGKWEPKLKQLAWKLVDAEAGHP